MSINIVDALDSEKAAERIRAEGMSKGSSMVVDSSDKMLKEILTMPKDNSVDKSKLVAMELRRNKKQKILQDIMENEASRIKDRFVKESVLRNVGELEENDPLRYMDDKGNVNLEWFVDKNNTVVKNEAEGKGEDVSRSYSPNQACDYYEKEGVNLRENLGDREKRGDGRVIKDEGHRRDGKYNGNRSQFDRKDIYKKDNRRHSDKDFRNKSYNRLIDDKENIHNQGPNDSESYKRPVNKNRSSDSGSGNYFCRICGDDRYFAWFRDNKASETHHRDFSRRPHYGDPENRQRKDWHRSHLSHEDSNKSNAKPCHKNLTSPPYNHHNDYKYQQTSFNNSKYENPQHNDHRSNRGPYSLHQNSHSPDPSKFKHSEPSSRNPQTQSFESSHANLNSTPIKPSSHKNPGPISANSHGNSSNFNEAHGESNATAFSDKYQNHSVNLKIPGNLSDTFKNEKKEDCNENKSSSGAEGFNRNYRHNHSPPLPRVRANDKFYEDSKAYKRKKFEDFKDPSCRFKRSDEFNIDNQKPDEHRHREGHLPADPSHFTKSKSYGRNKKRNSIKNPQSTNPEAFSKHSNPTRTPLAELTTSRGLLETPSLPPQSPQTPHKLNLYN